MSKDLFTTEELIEMGVVAPPKDNGVYIPGVSKSFTMHKEPKPVAAPNTDIYMSGILTDEAKLEQAIWLDYKSIGNGITLLRGDKKFIDNWFELDDKNPQLFGYLFT